MAKPDRARRRLPCLFRYEAADIEPARRVRRRMSRGRTHGITPHSSGLRPSQRRVNKPANFLHRSVSPFFIFRLAFFPRRVLPLPGGESSSVIEGPRKETLPAYLFSQEPFLFGELPCSANP